MNEIVIANQISNFTPNIAIWIPNKITFRKLSLKCLKSSGGSVRSFEVSVNEPEKQFLCDHKIFTGSKQ